MSRFLFISLFLVCAINHDVFGQNLEGANWLFGNQLGVKFISGEPDQFYGSQMSLSLRQANISDSAGDLIFYTDGVSVFNANHAITANGNIPYGSNPSVSGLCLINKRPNHDSIYDVFTTMNSFQTNFKYVLVHFEVNVSENDTDYVTQSLDTIQQNISQALAVLNHANGIDKWLLTHDYDSNYYYSRLITSSGPSQLFNVDTVGNSIYDNGSINRIKNSPNSELIISTYIENPFGGLELLQFNKSVGSVFNSIYLDTNFNIGIQDRPYSAAFSPNSKVAFATGIDRVVKYDLSILNANSIENSRSILAINNLTSNNSFFDLQLAVNGKIYVLDQRYDNSFTNSYHVSEISCSNDFTNVVYSDSVLSFNNSTGNSLPTLNQTLFVNADSFQVQMDRDTLCLGDTAQLQAYGSGADQFLWTLPDGTAAPHLSNDTIANPLCFSDTTITYRVIGIARNCTVDRFDTNFITVPVIAPSPSQAQIELLNGSLPLCFGDTVTLVFSASSTNATWLSPTSASDTLFIATADTVILEGTARCSTPVYDTVIVDTAATTMLSTSTDTTICQGDTITISVSGSNQAQWQSNAFLSDTTLANPLAFPPVDTIFVATTSLPCTQNDTVRVNVNPNEQIELSPDSILLCKDTSLTISAITNFQNLEWFPPQWVENSTTSTTRVIQGVEGWLTLNTSNRNCSTSDSVFVNTINPVEARASAEVLLTCEGYTVQTENTSIGASNYSWRLDGMEISTGVETEILNYNGQVITLLANNRECVDSTQLFISLDSAILSEVQPINVFTPNGDGVNDYFELRDEQFIHCSDLKVFTRWGQQVYDSNGMPPRWDGLTFGGEELPTGYYFYILTVNNKTFTGSVWLRR